MFTDMPSRVRLKLTPDEQVVVSRSVYSLRSMEPQNGVMANRKIKIVGGKQENQACLCQDGLFVRPDRKEFTTDT